MALFGLIREADVAELTEQLAAEVAQNEYVTERLAELELALDDVGWQRLSLEADWEFSRDGLDQIIALSRLNTLKNPLIRRGVSVKSHYVFGQGVEIQARDDDVNAVVQELLDDPANQNELFSAKARLLKDRTLTTDGNVVLVLFPNKLTGHVSVRSVDVGEIRDVIVNPDDRQDRWFYLRRWTEKRWLVDESSRRSLTTIAREAWYPDWRHQPADGFRLESIDGIQVRWDSPMYHVTVGELDGMRFGVPETYAALDWAKAYKLFLEDWATIVRSLSRFAWNQTVKKNPGAAARRMGSTVTPSTLESNPSPVAGAVFTHVDGVDLTPIPKSGATVESEDGVWLAKMVGAALDIPYTILMGDPDMGNLATAKTLDRPTELAMAARQQIWAGVLRDIASYQIDWAIRAAGGKLNGRQEIGPDGKRRWVLDPTSVDDGRGNQREMTGTERRTIDVTFPPILKDDIGTTIGAIVQAAGTELPNPKLILRLLLTALGVEDVDEHVQHFDDDQEARRKQQAEIGNEMVARFRAGRDPLDDEDDDA